MEVENAIQETNNLLNRARYQLNQGTYDASKYALGLALSANKRAVFARQRADYEDEAKAQQKRRNTASIEFVGAGAYIGAFFGAIVIGLAGCVSCLNNHTPNDMITDFNLFSGALYGAIGGALIGAI